MNLSDNAPLLIAALIVMALVLIADMGILFRWLFYQVKRQDFEAQFGYLPETSLPEYSEPDGILVPAMAGSVPAAGAATDESPEIRSADTPPGDYPSLASAEANLPTSPPPPYSMPPRPPFAPTWSLVHPFLGLQVALLLTCVLTMAPVILFMFLSPSTGKHAPAFDMNRLLLDVTVISLIVQNALFVGVVAFFLHRYGTSLSRIGLRRPSLRMIALGLGLGISVLLLMSPIEFVISFMLKHLLPAGLFQHLQKFSEAMDAGSMFQQIHSFWPKLIMLLGGAVAAPIGEEVFFRGLVYNALKARWKVPAAIIVSGLIFALIHFSPLGLIPIWLMGMLLAYVYERTQSLWVTILMHGINNGAIFVLLWLGRIHG